MNRRTFEEMVSYFNQTVADMDIDRKYKMELLGMITAILQRHDEDVKHAPTIECKTGRWNVYYHTPKDFSYSCNQCGYSAPYGLYGGEYSQKKWDFCPNCGARMEGEE